MIRIIFFVIACLGFSQIGIAGGASEREGVAQFAIEDIAKFSKTVERTLADKQALVAIVARNGRPSKELPEGVRYTHVGFAVYSEISLNDGTVQRGYAFHNLYQKAEQPDKSGLVIDYPLDFYSGAYEMKTGIIIPSSELQRKLVKVIYGEAYRNLHNANYSAIANPFDKRYQNCTEFVMNVTQAALYDVNTLDQVKANLKAWFDPYVIPFNSVELKLASLMSADVTTKDQQYPFVTATFTSIADYMSKYGLAKEVFVIQDLAIKPLLPVKLELTHEDRDAKR